jgi:hypothetical protein
MAEEILGSLVYGIVSLLIGIQMIRYGLIPSLYSKYNILNSKKWVRIAIIFFGSINCIYQVISFFYLFK